MRILIVEDDKHKREQVARHVKAVCEEREVKRRIVTRVSYRSGLSECVAKTPDLLILDMTMPTYDVGLYEQGGRPRHFAGRDILRELQRRKLCIPTVVFTGFDVIGEGTEQRTLAELTVELEKQFSDAFRGTVFYSTSESSWKLELTHKLLEVLEVEDDIDTDRRG